MIKHGGTLEEFLADPSVKGLPGLGDCSVLACNRQAVNESGTRLCHPHGKPFPALRREPGFDEEEWLRTAPSGSFGIEIGFRGLPGLVFAQLLFGLQHCCHRGARTEAGNFRALIDKTIRSSLARRLEDVPDPVANKGTRILLNWQRPMPAPPASPPRSVTWKPVSAKYLVIRSGTNQASAAPTTSSSSRPGSSPLSNRRSTWS
ncbi:hypothetical protein ACFV8E_19870 [Streptomyces sp. NPDC059849]|uniref:hypothetical protein n=1 Tax=Streptomyces sp. NPDC059849 TaxID=3346969 RepID=UPI003656707A